MDESQKKYLSDTENYNDTILNDGIYSAFLGEIIENIDVTK